MNQTHPEPERREASRVAAPALVTWTSLFAALTVSITIIGGAVAILNWLYTENNRLRNELVSVKLEVVKNQAAFISRPEFVLQIDKFTQKLDTRMDRLESRIIAIIEKNREQDEELRRGGGGTGR